MLPPKELNPFSRELFSQRILPGQQCHDLTSPPEDADANLQDRITELESRNLYLQSLVVELLDKNEQLRRKMQRQQMGDGLAP